MSIQPVSAVLGLIHTSEQTASPQEAQEQLLLIQPKPTLGGGGSRSKPSPLVSLLWRTNLGAGDGGVVGGP